MFARWTSRNAIRAVRTRSVSSSASGKSAPEIARGAEQLADQLRLLAVAVRALVAGVQRQAEHADRVRLPHPEERRRHREVLVDPRERERVRDVLRPARRRQRQRFLARRDPARAAAEHRPQLLVVEPRHPGGAERGEQRRRLRPVRVVGGVEHLLGGDEPVEVEQVERAPHGGVEEDARPAGEVACERGQVGDARVGDDQLRLVGVHQPGERVGDRRQAAAAVDQDRDAAGRPRARTRARAARRRAGTSARAGAA